MITQKGISLPAAGCMGVVGTEMMWEDIFVFSMVVQQNCEETKPNFCLVATTCGGPKSLPCPQEAILYPIQNVVGFLFFVTAASF